MARRDEGAGWFPVTEEQRRQRGQDPARQDQIEAEPV
jgi:hypothetical protein